MTEPLCSILLVLFFSIFFLPSTFSASDPPQHSPSPSPLPSPEYQYPPAPSPFNSPSPAPAMDPDADADIENKSSTNSNLKDFSSGGVSSGQKAGIALGVIAGGCVVIVGGVMYKKRQNNIRRSRFSYPSRVEMI